MLGTRIDFLATATKTGGVWENDSESGSGISENRQQSKGNAEGGGASEGVSATTNKGRNGLPEQYNFTS